MQDSFGNNSKCKISWKQLGANLSSIIRLHQQICCSTDSNGLVRNNTQLKACSKFAEMEFIPKHDRSFSINRRNPTMCILHIYSLTKDFRSKIFITQDENIQFVGRPTNRTCLAVWHLTVSAIRLASANSVGVLLFNDTFYTVTGYIMPTE